MSSKLLRSYVRVENGIVTSQDLRNFISTSRRLIALNAGVTSQIEIHISESTGNVFHGTDETIFDKVQTNEIDSIEISVINSDETRKISVKLRPIKSVNFAVFSNNNIFLIESQDDEWLKEAVAQLHGIASTIQHRDTWHGLYEVLMYTVPLILSVLILQEVFSKVTSIAFLHSQAALINLAVVSVAMLGCWFWGIHRFRIIYPKLGFILKPLDADQADRKNRFRKNLALDIVILVLWLLTTFFAPLRYLVGT